MCHLQLHRFWKWGHLFPLFLRCWPGVAKPLHATVSQPPNDTKFASISSLLINRPHRGIFWSIEEPRTVDCALSRHNVRCQFESWNLLTDYCVIICYEMWILCKNYLPRNYCYQPRSETSGQGVHISNVHAWKNKTKTGSVQIKRQDVKYLPTVTKISTWIN